MPITWPWGPAYIETPEAWHPYTAGPKLPTQQIIHQPQTQNINPGPKHSIYPIKETDTTKHNEKFLTYDFLHEWGEEKGEGLEL